MSIYMLNNNNNYHKKNNNNIKNTITKIILTNKKI